ncbi:MAG: VTT domain-containing protein [Burkholderiaceae bacterium]|nr:VTT domain-containing protein [Burkholderiaceae bacterium]
MASVLFALRSYWSYELLRSAYAVGVPALSNVRGWMTLREVADTYNVPAPALTQQLNLPEQTDSGSTLRSLAEREGTSPIDYVQRVQQAVAAAAPAVGAGGVVNRSGWFTSVGDRLAAGLRAYGYPVLAAALLLGAFGVPLPNGLLAALAGALAAKGELSLLWAGVVAVSMSVCGDMAGFGLGRALGNLQFAPWTRWLGFTPARSSRLQQILARNGVLTVLVSRTLVSGISSLLNLIAGAAGYGLYRFLALTVVGRVFWTGAYLGAGYAVGGELDNANRLLQNLTGVMVATVLALILIRMEIRQRRTMV